MAFLKWSHPYTASLPYISNETATTEQPTTGINLNQQPNENEKGYANTNDITWTTWNQFTAVKAAFLSQVMVTGITWH